MQPLEPRTRSWQLRTRTLQLDRRPLLMGVVNVTPDSFSDGGDFWIPTQRSRRHSGCWRSADILDIGGESTRPYSTAVAADEELKRVLPVIEAIHRQRPSAVMSIDTSKAAVAERALTHGVEIINDVTGLCADPAMMALAVPAVLASVSCICRALRRRCKTTRITTMW